MRTCAIFIDQCFSSLLFHFFQINYGSSFRKKNGKIRNMEYLLHNTTQHCSSSISFSATSLIPPRCTKPEQLLPQSKKLITDCYPEPHIAIHYVQKIFLILSFKLNLRLKRTTPVSEVSLLKLFMYSL
jgi:hypothetical protein